MIKFLDKFKSIFIVSAMVLILLRLIKIKYIQIDDFCADILAFIGVIILIYYNLMHSKLSLKLQKLNQYDEGGSGENEDNK